MCQDLSSNIRIPLANLQRSYLSSSLQNTLGQNQTRIPTIAAYFQQLFRTILLDHFFKDASLLVAYTHHPILLRVPVHVLQCLLWLVLWALLEDVLEKPLLGSIGNDGGESWIGTGRSPELTALCEVFSSSGETATEGKENVLCPRYPI